MNLFQRKQQIKTNNFHEQQVVKAFYCLFISFMVFGLSLHCLLLSAWAKPWDLQGIAARASSQWDVLELQAY